MGRNRVERDSLNSDKDSSSGTGSQECPESSRIILDPNIAEYGKPGYPFPLVLRLRVLQIVCGISSVVMGAVACIEERGRFHLSIAIPTGALTILAAGFSIFCSRGFGGYRPRPFQNEIYDSASGLELHYLSLIRIVGPPAVAIPTLLFWTAACSCHVALLILIYNVFASSYLIVSPFQESEEISFTLVALSIIFLILSFLTMLALICILRIEFLYDPD